MGGPDLLKNLFDPLRAALRAALAARGMAPAEVTALVELLDVAGVALLGTAMAPLAAHLYAAAASRRTAGRSAAAGAAIVLAGLAAAALLGWILSHPAPRILDLFTRWDHVVFAALAGGVLAGAAPAARAWALSLLSVAFMWQYCGRVATPIALGASLVAFAALGWRGGGRGPGSALVLGLVAVTVYCVCWQLRHTAFFDALQTFGLFSFVFLRQISAAVGLAGSARPAFGSYLCYLTFYPGGFGPLGGPEVYADFARRNLGGRLHHDAGRAARGVAWGALQIWAASHIPISAAAVFDSSTMLTAWGNSLLMFVRVALSAMGFWSMIDATALFLGFRLHPNFRGILTRQNPSELWWAWRGTFTNWLVRHVYAPLGANQRHQSANILAAFAVSWLWHALGIPFLGKAFTLFHLAPITLWAAVNAVAVVAHVQAQRRGVRILPAATPPALRRAIHIVLTACLGSLSVTFLQCYGDFVWRFVPFLRVLLGLPG